jgi:hypothetical protein
MNNTNTPPNKRQSEDTSRKNQIQTIFQYWFENTATASMVSFATGVPQKNICRYKRDLEKCNMLFEIEKKHCKHTGFKAWYITTDASKAPSSNIQLNLF